MLERDQGQDGADEMKTVRGWKTKRGRNSMYMCADGLRVNVANKAFKWVLLADRFGNRK